MNMDGMDGMDHSSMGHDDSSSMSMSMSMGMGTFHWSSAGDPFWFDSWVPKSDGAYVGACIGLFFFSIVSRGILAAEVYFIAWTAQKLENKRAKVQEVNESMLPYTDTKHNAARDSGSSTPAIQQTSSGNGSKYPSAFQLPIVPPFSWTNDTVRSFLTAFASFINYLLMLVVMTGNGGYFICVIVGVFVGEMMFGRYRSLGGFRDDHVH